MGIKLYKNYCNRKLVSLTIIVYYTNYIVLLGSWVKIKKTWQIALIISET